MNILYLSPSYFPLRGGTEQVAYELASRLKTINKIVILTIHWQKDMKPFEIIDGIEIYRTKGFIVKGLTLFLNYLSLFIVACKLHKKIKFDLVHMFHVYDCGGTAYLLKNILSIPLIITLAGWDTYSPIKKVQKKYMPIMRITMNAANYVTAPSHHLGNAGKAQGCKKEIEIIPHGSDMHEKITSINPAIIKNLDSKNKKIIVSVLRLSKIKGTKNLLEAIPNVISKINNALFIVIGKGKEEESLKTLAKTLSIQNHLLFPGFIDRQFLPSYYSIADLFVLPSLYESFGLVYIEAMCFGIPIVTTINGGSRDIVHGKNGILVPPEDPDKLSLAIIDALNKKWDREAIKTEAEKYRWEDIVVKYENFYKEMINKK